MPNTPSLSEYEAAAAAAYGLSSGNFVAPTGMTILKESSAAQLSDGFAAVALKDSNGNVIIVNEGTVPDATTAFGRGTLAADIKISNDQTAQALTDANTFASQVEQQYGAVYVDGHSLGGIEAESECKTLNAINPNDCLGGATFGATGLPGDASAGGPTNLVDYVDYGDPVGNFASDPTSPLSSIAPNGMYHYGSVVMVGSPSDANVLSSAATNINASVNATDSWAEFGANGGETGDAYAITALSLMAQGLGKDHPIGNYASDLGISGVSVTPSATDEFDIAEMYGLSFGSAGMVNAENATINSNGSLTTPDFTINYNATTGQMTVNQTSNMTGSWGVIGSGGTTTISINPTTGLVTSETYTSPDLSVYSATINSVSQEFQTLKVNENNGSSYQINYNYSPSANTEQDTGYSGSNESGTQLYTQTDTTSSNGSVSASISGTGDNTNLNSATITVANNTQANVSGTGNIINDGSGDNLGMTGNSANNTVNLSTGDNVTVSGNSSATSNTFHASGTGNAITLNSASESATLTGNSVTMTANGNSDVCTVSGTSDVLSLLGASDSATLSGACSVSAAGTGDAMTLIGGSCSATLTGTNESVTASGANDVCTASGTGDILTLKGTTDSATLSGTETLTASGNGAKIYSTLNNNPVDEFNFLFMIPGAVPMHANA